MNHDDHSAHHATPTQGAALSRLAFTATVHCLTGCAIGEVLGMVIGTALNWGNFATVALAVVLAFVFGYGLTMRPLLASGLATGAVLKLALAADTVSITIMEVVDNALMLVIPGAMDAPVDSGLFWGSLALSLLVAGAAAFPVNRWLIARGRGHAVVHATMGPAITSRIIMVLRPIHPSQRSIVPSDAIGAVAVTQAAHRDQVKDLAQRKEPWITEAFPIVPIAMPDATMTHQELPRVPKRIHRRRDAAPSEGLKKYGNTLFADPTNKKYPIDTPGRIKAAWSYIHQPSNAAKYTAGERRTIKGRIRQAAKAGKVALPDPDEFVELMGRVRRKKRED
jgi:hypothetical protein